MQIYIYIYIHIYIYVYIYISQKTWLKNGRRSKCIFLQRRHIDAKSYKRRGSVSLIVTEMQVKTTMRCPLTLVKMAILKKKKNPQAANAGEGVGRMKSSCTVGENVSWFGHYGDQYGESLINQK